MGTVDKEQLLKVRNFLAEHPEAAKKFFEENPEALQKLTGEVENNSNNLEGNSRGGNSMGGKQLVKTMPGAKIPRMFEWDEQGFSNYLMLAALAFSIQLIITLICIFFYK